MRIFRRIGEIYCSSGLRGLLGAIRYRFDRFRFHPHTRYIRLLDKKFLVHVEDFEASTWYAWHRYPHRLESPMVELRWIQKYTKNNEIVFDIGAHQGLWSMLFASCAEDGEVHAFETSVFNTAVAEKNIASNRFRNIHFNHLCLGDREGWISASDDSAGVVTIPTNSTRIKVPITAGDRYAAENGWPSFIKIDVEGFEPEVLSGLRQCLSRTPKIILEISQAKFQDRFQYVTKCLSYLPVSSYHVFAQYVVGSPMTALDHIDDRVLKRLASGKNSHLYFLPK